MSETDAKTKAERAADVITRAAADLSQIVRNGALLVMKIEGFPDGVWHADITRLGVADALGNLLHNIPPETAEAFAKALADEIIKSTAQWAKKCPDCLAGKPIEGHG